MPVQFAPNAASWRVKTPWPQPRSTTFKSFIFPSLLDINGNSAGKITS